MSNTIREATPADVPGLEVVRQQAVEAGFTEQYDRDDFVDLVATPDDRIPDWIDAPGTLVLVAETDVTTVGYGAYAPSSGRILALYTAPAYQGEGCATELLDRFERRARRDGRGQLRATVPLNAAGFFRNRGFERRERTERHGVAHVVVTKSLS